jgi:membrane associated rhomboid family serine protease
MGKYGRVGRQVSTNERPWRVHPIWMGIGCLLLILIPIIAYAGATLLVEANVEAKWIAVSSDLMRTITIPFLGLKIPHLIANLLAAAVLALIGFGVLMVFYAILYSIIGPEKYSPLDSPPVKQSPKSSWLKK